MEDSEIGVELVDAEEGSAVTIERESYSIKSTL